MCFTENDLRFALIINFTRVGFSSRWVSWNFLWFSSHSKKKTRPRIENCAEIRQTWPSLFHTLWECVTERDSHYGVRDKEIEGKNLNGSLRTPTQNMKKMFIAIVFVSGLSLVRGSELRQRTLSDENNNIINRTEALELSRAF